MDIKTIHKFKIYKRIENPKGKEIIDMWISERLEQKRG